MRELGSFILKKPVGRGATAQVYLASHKDRPQEDIALKIFHPGLWSDGDLRRRMMSEFEVASSLCHPNVVRVLEPLWEYDPPAVAMEYIDGQSLEEFQARLPYVVPEISALILIEVLKALEEAHSRGVIHRDLKPANILVGKEGRVLVSDFGLAKMVDVARQTLSGAVLGSPDFMSPEQARGDTVNHRSDLYSAASVLYFLVTGTRPFSRHSPLATLAAVNEGKVEPAQRRNPKVSLQLSGILRHAMSSSPEDRYGSAKEFREALQTYLSRLGIVDDGVLSRWMATPGEVTLQVLKVSAESLILQSEKSLDKRDWNGSLEAISHLSLVAPESAAIPRLMKQFEQKRRDVRRKPYIFAILAALLSLAGFGVIVSSYYKGKKQFESVHNSTAAFSPRLPPVKSAVTKAFPVPQKKEKTENGLVRFDVPKEIRIYWDGLPIGSSRSLRNQMEGRHKVRLEKDGVPAIEKTILVKATEPTLIRVR